MPWNPDQYEMFKTARSAPFEDLVATIDRRPDLRVIDLGCGTGELTARLADLLPNSTVLGIDNSPEMLNRAAAFERSGLRFEQQQIESVRGEWDLVFSHAAVQWVDDHEQLIPKLMSLVCPGGQIAVQMPSNHKHITHASIPEITAEEPFRSALNGWSRHSPVLPLPRYAELLFEAGATQINAFEKIYPVIMDNADGLIEWTKGTTLVPVLERLPPELHAAFMDRYRARLWQEWPEGQVFYAFQRILVTARRA